MAVSDFPEIWNNNFVTKFIVSFFKYKTKPGFVVSV